MKVNMASWDRVIRVLVGLLLIALSLTGIIGLWGWIGVIPVATGLIGNCPLYSILGFSTCKRCKADEK